MPLEATLLLADNSDYSINSDYTPTRWEACADALHLIFNAKCNSNQESQVGVMTEASEPDGSRRPQVLLSLTNDSIKLVAALHGLRQSGELDLVTSISVAQLALKHRENKNQHQRIIAMVGSPLPSNEAHTPEALAKLGKKLKKNNVALDVISYGETSDNGPALQALVEAANSSDNSHLLVAPPTSDVLLSEVVRSSAILAEEFGGGAGGDVSGVEGGAGGGNADGFGVDPNLDPELAMALRVSLEDERARQQAANPPAPTASSSQAATSVPTTATAASQQAMDVDESASKPAQSAPSAAKATEEDDPDLAMAMAMSRGEDIDMGSDTSQSNAQQHHQPSSEDEEDEEEIKRAIALSLQGDNGQDKK